MTLTKNKISKNLSSELNIPLQKSKKVVNFFFDIQKDLIKSRNLKLSKFGSYYKLETPERFGRNPKTMEQHKIPKKLRISFKPANNIRSILN